MTPPGEGWRQWLHMFSGESPTEYVEVEVWRDGWDEPRLQVPEANPHMNAVGLWWRPASPKRSPEERLRQALRIIHS